MTASIPPFWFIVPAAGIGQRMGSACPKQYLPLAGATILEQTLSTLLSVSQAEGIVLALHPDDQYWSTLELASHPKIHPVIGGAERSDSVLASLNYLQPLVDSSSWVLVHDAARPCITRKVVERQITTLADDDVGGILGVPASDTLKRVTAEQQVSETLDRSHIWQAQTPQMFRFELLHQALLHCQGDMTVTDEASAVEKQGYCVKMVQGFRDNIKVTHPDDLWLAEAILKKQLSAVSD